jgi:uncharacterized protein
LLPNRFILEKKTFLYLALFTLVGFSGLGFIIIENFLALEFFTVLFSGELIWIQVVMGLAFGYITAAIGWRLIETQVMLPVRNFFSQMIKNFNLSFPEILFISFCAGVGEEILFRGAIQPYLGVWATAILFVAIHGYLNPFNWRLSMYGLFMTFVIAGIGYLTINFGLITAIAAHSMIDIFLLYKLAHDHSPQEDFSESS